MKIKHRPLPSPAGLAMTGALSVKKKPDFEDSK
jgi:hypothetical protein